MTDQGAAKATTVATSATLGRLAAIWNALLWRNVDFYPRIVPIPMKPPVYNGMIAPRDSWMMPPPGTR